MTTQLSNRPPIDGGVAAIPRNVFYLNDIKSILILLSYNKSKNFDAIARFIDGKLAYTFMIFQSLIRPMYALVYFHTSSTLGELDTFDKFAADRNLGSYVWVNKDIYPTESSALTRMFGNLFQELYGIVLTFRVYRVVRQYLFNTL